MISDFVANTTRNCEGMMNIIKNMNVFLENNDKLLPFNKQINISCKFYEDDSMKAIKNDLINIGMNSINWKSEQENLTKIIKGGSFRKSHAKSHAKFHEIILKKPKINKLSDDSIMKLIELKDIESKEKGLEFISYRKSIKSQLKNFPKEITEFENNLILQRNNNVKNVMKLIKNLLKEHQKYVYSTINKKPFMTIDGIVYKDSQKEFVKENLSRLIKINP